MEEFLKKLYFCQIFFENFVCVFSKVKHSIGHISGMVGPIDVKRKGCASVGYWANYVTLTFDLTHDLYLVVSRSKFEIALFEEWGADWHATKGMWVDHSWPWLWPMGNLDGVGGCTYSHHIVTGVTSDVGVPSTYLVVPWHMYKNLLKFNFKLWSYLSHFLWNCSAWMPIISHQHWCR